MSKEKHVVIIDNIGRNIIGKFVSETETTLTLNNPVILHAQPTQEGQIQVQSFPLFFFEFSDKDQRDKNDWVYNKATIVQNNVVLAKNILEQYSKINTPQVEAPAAKSPKIISINDL